MSDLAPLERNSRGTPITPIRNAGDWHVWTRPTPAIHPYGRWLRRWEVVQAHVPRTEPTRYFQFFRQKAASEFAWAIIHRECKAAVARREAERKRVADALDEMMAESAPYYLVDPPPDDHRTR